MMLSLNTDDPIYKEKLAELDPDHHNQIFKIVADMDNG